MLKFFSRTSVCSDPSSPLRPNRVILSSVVRPSVPRDSQTWRRLSRQTRRLDIVQGDMLEQTFAIIRNTFYESIRQPIVLVVLVAGTLAIILSNPLSAFTMDDDQRMLVDIGLATVFLCGALLAALIATSVLTREIENKTALTVVSKPVGRPLFIIGKYLGVSGALLLATLYLGLVFMLVEMHGTLQTVRDPIHVPVVFFGIGAAMLGVGVAVWCNYFYGKVFTSTVLCVTTPLAALAYLMAMMFKHDFTLLPTDQWAFNGHLWIALAAMMIAILVLTSIAIAASTRLSQVMTLGVTLAAFLIGMLSDWFFGRRLNTIRSMWEQRALDEGVATLEERTRTIVLISGEASPPITETEIVSTVPLASMAEGSELLAYGFYKTLYSIVPNFQVHLLIDALTQSHRIPANYIGNAAVYGAMCIAAALSVAVILFQRREVG